MNQRGWKKEEIGDLCDFSNGHGFSQKDWAEDGLPIIRIQNLNGSTEFNYYQGKPEESWLVKPGTILFAWAGTRGVSFGPKVWDGPLGVLNQHIYRVHPRKEVDGSWLYLALRLVTDRIERMAHGFKSTLLHVGKSDITSQTLNVPPLPEQRKIADILSTWDEALEKLDALIQARERQKKALMQQLLTGKKRVKGFSNTSNATRVDRFGSYPADWRRVALGQITKEVSSRNPDKSGLPVLSCTKHHGLVLSDEYFGRRVYSEDTSKYRMVKRGEFAYATNHIEEGSIGYQNICDAGLVSPIYTVFKAESDIDALYLFRVLKSPLLVHLYRANTSASVDRRGSLRYDEFSQIYIWIPSKEEQKAIAEILDVADNELGILRAQRIALAQQKRGLMQRLLTGKIRVKTPSAAE
jgi:type I restriction enzyme, S subunit